MFANVKLWAGLVALTCLTVEPMTNNASAMTLEVAKKCEALVVKAYPPRQIGNPAAGSAKGTAQEIQSYFTKCLANGGNVDAEDKKNDHGLKDAK